MRFCPSLSGQLYPRRCNKLLRLLGGPLGMCDRFTPASLVSLSAVANAVVLLRYITIKARCQGTTAAEGGRNNRRELKYLAMTRSVHPNLHSRRDSWIGVFAVGLRGAGEEVGGCGKVKTNVASLSGFCPQGGACIGFIRLKRFKWIRLIRIPWSNVSGPGDEGCFSFFATSPFSRGCSAAQKHGRENRNQAP